MSAERNGEGVLSQDIKWVDVTVLRGGNVLLQNGTGSGNRLVSFACGKFSVPPAVGDVCTIMATRDGTKTPDRWKATCTFSGMTSDFSGSSVAVDTDETAI